MEKKIVLLKDLNEHTKFPVVDLVKSEDGTSRLGCATTGLVNFICRCGLFDPDKFSNVAEMALYYEQEFKGIGNTQDDNVSAERAFEVIDTYLNENPETIERYIYRADTASLETILFLLANDFVGLICSKTNTDGHCDILFCEDGKVFYNCFEVNLKQMAEIIFSSPANMFCFGRSLKTHKRFAMKASEMGSIKIKLTAEQKQYLSHYDIFTIENDLMAIFDKYPTHKIPELLKNKEYALKNLKLLDEDLLIIYPPPLAKSGAVQPSE